MALLMRRSRSASGSGNPAQYRAAMVAGIRDGRSLAAIAGMSRMRAELAALRHSVAEAGIGLFDLAADAGRVVSAATSHTARVVRLASEHGLTLRDAANAATGSLRRIGVSESADAFNGARLKAARAARARVSLFRAWDAALDKRSCRICERADGTIVGVGESFPTGEPGAVHPHCRCSWTLLRAEEVDTEMFIEAA